MKKILLTIIILLLASQAALYAQDSGLGMGVILGEPSGLSFKLWFDVVSALDLGVAWSFAGIPSMNVHTDYLYHFFGIFPDPLRNLQLYTGIGGTVKIDMGLSNVGIRIPVGLTFFLVGAPMDIFLEIVPIMYLYPRTEMGMNAGIGVRFFLSDSGMEEKPVL